MAAHGDPVLLQQLQLPSQGGEVGLVEQSVLVELEESQGHPEEYLGALVEDRVPDPEHGLHRQDLAVETDEPLGGEESPGHLESLDMSGYSGHLLPRQSLQHLQVGQQSRHGLGVVVRQESLTEHLQQPETAVLVLGGEVEQSGDVVESLAVANVGVVVEKGSVIRKASR